MRFKVGIIANELRDPGLQYAREVEQWLLRRGCQPVAHTDRLDGCDFLVILGGDGTVLRASHGAAPHGIPMLGINLGSLGYLTDVDRHEGFAALEKVLAGDYRTEKRMMREARGELALNEILIHRGTAGPITFEITLNGKHMDSLRADGIITATPTGSTAYNLSAGGPILRPDIEMIVLTAVCPHTLSARPWVLSGEDVVTISPGGGAEVILDGEKKFTLTGGEIITLQASKHRATVIKTSGMDFFEILRKKMAR